MNILVDSGLKKKIQIENRKHRRGIYYLWLFEKIFFALVIAYAILFPIYCKVTGNLVSTNMRTGKLTDVHKINITEMVDSNIKINDYFTPSLYEILKSKIN